MTLEEGIRLCRKKAAYFASRYKGEYDLYLSEAFLKLVEWMKSPTGDVRYLSKSITHSLYDLFRKSKELPKEDTEPTYVEYGFFDACGCEREVAVVTLRLQGYDDAEIGLMLHCSARTIQNIRLNVAKRLMS